MIKLTRAELWCLITVDDLRVVWLADPPGDPHYRRLVRLGLFKENRDGSFSVSKLGRERIRQACGGGK